MKNEGDAVLEEPEVHAHHHGSHSGHRWFDITASVCAMVVSFASLYLAIHHGHVMQQMAEANSRMVTATSWPHVSYSTSNVASDGSDSVIRFSLTNKGIGPARIEGMEVRLDGQPVKSVRELLNACCSAGGENAATQVSWRLSTANGEILRPGEDKAFLHLSRHADPAVWSRIRALPDKVAVKVCYCSVFDECWVAQSTTNQAERVKACPANWTQYSD
jgi:hypothetical protein